MVVNRTTLRRLESLIRTSDSKQLPALDMKPETKLSRLATHQSVSKIQYHSSDLTFEGAAQLRLEAGQQRGLCTVFSLGDGGSSQKLSKTRSISAARYLVRLLVPKSERHQLGRWSGNAVASGTSFTPYLALDKRGQYDP